MDERVWLTYPEHGGHFHCPAEAVEAWTELGWVPADSAPEEPNPVTSEHLAWRAELAQAAEQAAEEEPKSSQAKTWTKTTELSQEG